MKIKDINISHELLSNIAAQKLNNQEVEIIKDTYETNPIKYDYLSLNNLADWCVGKCDKCNCQSGPQCKKNSEDV